MDYSEPNDRCECGRKMGGLGMVSKDLCDICDQMNFFARLNPINQKVFEENQDKGKGKDKGKDNE